MSLASSWTFDIERHPNPATDSEREALLRDPAWGRVFTDHMVTLRYSEGRGWHDWKIGPREAIPLHPGSMALHYALEIFEGMKAYRLPDGGAALFRPEANARRFRDSAERLSMALLPEDLFIESVQALVGIDRNWIPTSDGAALYLRPFMIGLDAALATKPADAFLFCVVASPVAAYFSSGASAVTLWVSETYTRAAPGGTGAAKCGGNYAAGLLAQSEGRREGCDQIVFLDAVERRWVEELGGMNVFFVFEDGSLQTPPLTGTILPGITRDSIIALAFDLGWTVREEPYSIDQWQEDARSGRLAESFACGTAAVVTPIGRVKGRRHAFTIGGGGIGPVTQILKETLTDIQFGRAPDTHRWMRRAF
ncbi:MAG: branched chain amino acid aminotransferase [Rhizobiales bacterium 32-66-8]|nr:MAG: branched chain amino acid aminotransferase [Rhizobiales bacterium 32-66-8]